MGNYPRKERPGHEPADSRNAAGIPITACFHRYQPGIHPGLLWGKWRKTHPADRLDHGGVLYELVLRYGFGLDFETEPHPDFEESQLLLVIDSHGASNFILCLDDEIPLELVQQLDLDEDDRFVCRPEALDDETAALLSEHCRVKFI